MRKGTLTSVTIAIVCAVTAAPAAAAGNPELSNQRLSRSLGDLSTLVPKSGKLGGLARQARSALKSNKPCEASKALRTLRSGASRTKNISLSVRADIQAATLNAETIALSRSAASGCGGTTRPSVTSPLTRVLSSSPGELKLRFSLPTPRFASQPGGGRGFARLVMEGMSASDLGKPDVPIMRRAFAIPEGAKVSVSVPSRHTMTLSGVDLAPRQDTGDAQDPEPPRTSYPGADAPIFAAKPFQLNTSTYQSRAAFPAKPVSVDNGGDWRGFRVGVVNVAGAQYSPARKALRVNTALDLTINFAGGSGKFNSKQIATQANRHMLNVYRAALVNARTALANLKDLTLKACGEEVLILTEPAYRAAADRLAGLKRARGLITNVFEVGSGAGQAGTTPQAIYNFIKSRRETDCGATASFLIMFGKGIPTFSRPNERDPSNMSKLVVGDYDYIVASPEFLLPVMHTGRIPAKTLDEANAAVDKIAAFEANAPADPGFYSRTSMAAYFQIDENKSRESRGFVQYGEKARAGMMAAGKTVDRFYVKQSGATPKYFNDGTEMPTELKNHGWNSTATDIVSAINAGRSVVLHNDHGYAEGWGDPNLTSGHIPSMTNANELSFFVNINCSSGHFDDPTFASFAERLMLHTGGGAIGVIASSRMSNTWANDYLLMGITDAMFPKTLPNFGVDTPITSMGEILTMGKIGLWLTLPTGQGSDRFVRDHWRLYNLFGDPTVNLRLSAP